MADGKRFESIWADLRGVSFSQGWLNAGGVRTRYLHGVGAQSRGAQRALFGLGDRPDRPRLGRPGHDRPRDSQLQRTRARVPEGRVATRGRSSRQGRPAGAEHGGRVASRSQRTVKKIRMSSNSFDTDVIVVRSGSTGGTAAMALATCGIRVTVATYWNWTANSPRAHITNQRTMEVLRDLGVEEEARKYETPWEAMGDTLFATSFAGEEIARLRTWGTGDERVGDYVRGSPCAMADIPQTGSGPVGCTTGPRTPRRSRAGRASCRSSQPLRRAIAPA